MTKNRKLNIQFVGLGELGALLDELETRLGLVAHQLIDNLGRQVTLVLNDLDAEQRAHAAVHGRLFELLRQHLAQALETRDIDLPPAVEL